MRVFVAICATLALSACNWVVTKAPLFGPGDQAGAPHLRSGVWSAGSSSDCTFDERKPITAWPDCAGRMVIKDGRWMTLDKKGGRWTWTSLSVVLAGGAPQVLQVAPDADGKSPDAGYSYYGVAAAQRDRSGRITTFRTWPVLCAPPAPQAKAGDTGPPPVTHPFPGLTMDANDSDCTTASRDAVRQAADASQLWSETTFAAHWVRDGDR
jgi:hypothetical protein